MESYVHGVSTRKVDDLVRALGIDAGISKSEVSRICAELDEQVAEFTGRPISEPFPYLFLDATYLKAHEGPQVVSKAVVIATGVRGDGHREVLGLDVGDSEDGAFWTAFLRGLRARGLSGVKLVISDAHEGLKTAIGAVLLGAAWQRCRVHFMRNLLGRVPKGSQEMVAAAIRTIFAQPDRAAVAEQLDSIAEKLGRQFPAVEQLLRAAEADITAFACFPQAHWRRIWSTDESVNPATQSPVYDRGQARATPVPKSRAWGGGPCRAGLLLESLRVAPPWRRPRHPPSAISASGRSASRRPARPAPTRPARPRGPRPSCSGRRRRAGPGAAERRP